MAGCSSLDAKCICSNDTFIQNITCCISEACDTDDRNTAIKAATDLCSSVGVDVPTSVTCTNGTSTSTITAPSSTATSDDNDNAARRLDGVQAGALGAVAVAAMLLV